ncbi:MAG: hypothetical protein N2C12_08475 [Planctomycetales bacterium]
MPHFLGESRQPLGPVRELNLCQRGLKITTGVAGGLLQYTEQLFQVTEAILQGVFQVDDLDVIHFKDVFQLLRALFLAILFGTDISQHLLLSCPVALEFLDSSLVLGCVLDPALLNLLKQFFH